MPCRLMWHDGLQNDRGVLKYFMHFYPCSHLKETLEATNANFEAARITQYFCFTGLLLACSFYSTFSIRQMFLKSSDLRRTKFLAVPDLSQYMTLNRFTNIMRHLDFSVGNGGPAFWKVQPLVDAFNECRKVMCTLAGNSWWMKVCRGGLAETMLTEVKGAHT